MKCEVAGIAAGCQRAAKSSPPGAAWRADQAGLPWATAVRVGVFFFNDLRLGRLKRLIGLSKLLILRISCTVLVWACSAARWDAHH
jgi:hypothetical protein